MIKVNLYDIVELKDGRTATIVEVFENSYVADIELEDGEYDTQFITPDEVVWVK